MVIVIMGVSGSGKTTVGKLLALALGADFQEGDDFHPPHNIIKMKSGIPLSDEDRWPWLQTLAAAIDQWTKLGQNVVLTCSALKESYRQLLIGENYIKLVYLKGPEFLLRQRLESRTDHFMPASLLESQLAALEEPEDALILDIASSADSLANEIHALLGVSVENSEKS